MKIYFKKIIYISIMDTSCVICFDDLTDKVYSCCDRLCTGRICESCLIDLLNFSHNNNILPKCPLTACQAIFTLKQISTLDKSHIQKYMKTCVNALMSKDSDKVSKQKSYDELIENMRKQKFEFIENKFPPAIRLAAELCHKPKIRKVNTGNLKNAIDQVEKTKRLCMNTFCNGRINDNYECLSCLTRFCKMCEKRLGEDEISATENDLVPTFVDRRIKKKRELVDRPYNAKLKVAHPCKPEDIASVAEIRKMIKCPQCNISVEKADGCNSITCANCQTNFDYLSGEKCVAGNHGKSKFIKVLDKILPTISHKEFFEKNPEMMDIMVQIELLSPSSPEDKMISLLKKHDQPGYDKKIALLLARQYTFQYQSKYYQSMINDIEKAIFEKTLSVERLQTLLNDLKK